MQTVTLDDEVNEALAEHRPQPKPGGKGLAAIIERDRVYRSLFKNWSTIGTVTPRKKA